MKGINELNQIKHYESTKVKKFIVKVVLLTTFFYLCLMKQPRVLIETEHDQEYRNFDFVISDANGIYIVDSETMCVILNGTDFILEYNKELYEEIKKNIAIKNLMNKN